MNADYLIIIRKEGPQWVVDEDSEHILAAHDYPVELRVRAVRSLAPTPEATSSDNGGDSEG